MVLHFDRQQLREVSTNNVGHTVLDFSMISIVKFHSTIEL